ncbi:lytic transglycosylase domain-containing protein [Pseudomonas jilinensis]|uniref:Lytic transglycosylase n=1 Tax=Pseudomonas jilinensis TaxID=2078689 RepID=A0A396S0Q6_9PSED|nr:lytic transglycosylase domain-containing protein [Pseudomonas jilinensis]RHW22515.1 lytic transglycosylase [Pseudomonas jilinensis]
MRRICCTALLSLGCLALESGAGETFYRGESSTGTLILTNVHRPGQGLEPVVLHARTGPSASVRVAPIPSHELAELVRQTAAEHDLPEGLLHAVIQTESGYNPLALSPKGAAGLMQLMPATARELEVEDVWDPGQNLAGGARYLKQMMELFEGDLELGLAAYNAGPGRVSRAGGIPDIGETQRYVPLVMQRYLAWRGTD